jgi:hypothetical protein
MYETILHRLEIFYKVQIVKSCEKRALVKGCRVFETVCFLGNYLVKEGESK